MHIRLCLLALLTTIPKTVLLSWPGLPETDRALKRKKQCQRQEQRTCRVRRAIKVSGEAIVLATRYAKVIKSHKVILTVLTPARAQFAVGAIADAVHRPMMGLMNLAFCTAVKVEDAYPTIGDTTGDKPICKRWVQRSRRERYRDRVPFSDLATNVTIIKSRKMRSALANSFAVERMCTVRETAQHLPERIDKVHVLARSDGQEFSQRSSRALHRGDGLVKSHLMRFAQRPHVPPSDHLIFAHADHRRLVATPLPDDTFDITVVGCPIFTIDTQVICLGVRSRQVKEAQLLLVAARQDTVARRGDGCCPDNVLMGKCVQACTRVGIPDFAVRKNRSEAHKHRLCTLVLNWACLRGEVCACGHCPRRIAAGELAAPDRALVA